MSTESKLFYRTFQIDRAKINPDKREIELSFSSETPVRRGRGFEVLDHSTPGAADFSRLNAGAPLLVDHNPEKLIGAVVRGSARVDAGDKTGRALVRFGKGPLAQEIFTDVVDGIRAAVSVGYEHGKLLAKEV